MRKAGSILLWLLTVSILILGVHLPEIVSSRNDDRSFETERYTVSTVSLEQADKEEPESLIDALSIYSEFAPGNYGRMDLETGNRLTSQTAYESALTALSFMAEYGILEDYVNYAEHMEAPAMIYTEDTERAIIVWECWLTNDAGGTIFLCIDDETGGMLAFEYAVSADSMNQVYTVPFVRIPGEAWSEMCIAYYGFKSADTVILTRDGTNTGCELIFSDEKGGELILYYQTSYYVSEQTVTSTEKYPQPLSNIRFNMIGGPAEY